MSVRACPSGNGWRWYATYAIYDFPKVSEYQGPVASKAEAYQLARAEAAAIESHVASPRILRKG
jgi:hypothetical protein